MSDWQVQIQKTTILRSTCQVTYFQQKIDEIFSDLPNVFGIADDILVVGYDSDGKDHDKTLWQVIQICRNVNLKFNKDKCHFWCTSVLFFKEVITRVGVQPNP